MSEGPNSLPNVQPNVSTDPPVVEVVQPPDETGSPDEGVSATDNNPQVSESSTVSTLSMAIKVYPSCTRRPIDLNQLGNRL